MKNSPIHEIYKFFLSHQCISTDSRKIEKDCIYFALKGENFNGNDFAEEALAKGAKLVIVDEERNRNNNQYIYVSDVLTTLQELAAHHRSQLSIPIIGITGSNGKTTTKELIARVLSKKKNTLMTQGNLNNHIGVPLTILKIKKEHEIAIIEMGANHIGEIAFLSSIAQPNYGLITNIGKAHLEGFGGIEGVKKGKSELYQFIRKHRGKAFLNSDDSTLIDLCQIEEKYTYGCNKSADCRGELLEREPFIKGKWQSKSSSGVFNSQLIGEYNFYNIMSAICIGDYFNVPSNSIIEAIENYKPDMNRSQLLSIEDYHIILDAYNANPTSMQMALKSFNERKGNRKVAILGDMFELGDSSEKEHLNMVKLCEKLNNLHQVVFVGEHFYRHKNESKQFLFYKTAEECKKWFKQFEKKDNHFLLKGSRGMKMEEIIKPTKKGS